MDLNRKEFDRAVDYALGLALYHAGHSLSGENPAHFKGLSLNAGQQAIVRSHYQDVLDVASQLNVTENDWKQLGEEGSAVLSQIRQAPLAEALKSRRARYEHLLLDSLAVHHSLPNKADFLEGKTDTLQIPSLKEVAQPKTVFFTGPYGVGDYDFAKNTETLLKGGPAVSGAASAPLSEVFQQGAVWTSTELTKHILKKETSSQALDDGVQAAYFRADQSAIANALDALFKDKPVHRVSTERFVHPHLLNPEAAARKLGDHPIVITTLANPKDDALIERIAEDKGLPVAQVRESMVTYATQSLPMLRELRAEKNFPLLQLEVSLQSDGKSYDYAPPMDGPGNWTSRSARENPQRIR